MFATYENNLAQFEATERQMKVTEFEANTKLLSPILLCVALALRFAKVAGEISLEQAKASASIPEPAK